MLLPAWRWSSVPRPQVPRPTASRPRCRNLRSRGRRRATPDIERERAMGASALSVRARVVDLGRGQGPSGVEAAGDDDPAIGQRNSDLELPALAKPCRLGPCPVAGRRARRDRTAARVVRARPGDALPANAAAGDEHLVRRRGPSPSTGREGGACRPSPSRTGGRVVQLGGGQRGATPGLEDAGASSRCRRRRAPRRSSATRPLARARDRHAPGRRPRARRRVIELGGVGDIDPDAVEPAPATRTLPSGRSVAVWDVRPRLMLAVGVQVPVAGS